MQIPVPPLGPGFSLQAVGAWNREVRNSWEQKAFIPHHLPSAWQGKAVKLTPVSRRAAGGLAHHPALFKPVLLSPGLAQLPP